MSAPFVTIPVIAWLIAQVIKVVVDSLQKRRLDLRRLATAGGMPSSHTALVVSLTTVLGARRGVTSPEFALSAIFTSVVMYDATGVRRAAGRQAAVLNRIIDDLFHQEGIKEERLRELIGHTPVEVIAGALLGSSSLLSCLAPEAARTRLDHALVERGIAEPESSPVADRRRAGAGGWGAGAQL